MSAVLDSYTYEMDASYAADYGRDREPIKTKSRHPEYRRKGSAPSRVSGMHCRRQKRWTWGAGRGARMANLRAFAGCLAIAIAAAASSAQAVNFNWGTTVSGSNAAYTSGSWASVSGGIGSVNYTYRVATTETTRGQYAEFLNAVARSSTAPSYVLSLWSGTSTGITRTLASGTYTYSTTTPTLPVSSVTWTSAARFVNWLNNGQVATSNTTTLNTALNTGAYTLATSSTGSTVVNRTAGYTTAGSTDKFFLPSANEWVKAAFYNPGSATWNTWQNGSSSTPFQVTSTSTTNLSSANAGVYGSPAPRAVGSIVNSKSPYGLYDMLGNITEMTDTANGLSQYFAASGSYLISSSGISAWNINSNQYLSATAASIGFRVAGIAAVPEPETITLAAFGVVGLCGANWLKRRRASARPAAA